MSQGQLFTYKKKEIVRERENTPFVFNRQRDDSWDYHDIMASTGIYGIHPYPAMFHFMLVRRLLREFSKEKDWAFDPFMGSGVSGVECLISNRNFIGYDINPLAVMITKVRTTPLDSKIFFRYLEKIITLHSSVKAEKIYFPNIDFWFDDYVISELAKLRSAILGISNPKIQNFFIIAFSQTVRRVSLSDHNEFKLIRRKKRNGNMPVIKIFKEISIKNIGLLKSFYDEFKVAKSKIKLEPKNILETDLEPNSIDFIITSPPYGDSQTTVAYGQFSRLPLRWLGWDEKVDRDSLGSKKRKISYELPSQILYQGIEKIAELNPKRAEEVFSFYFDLFRAITIMATALKPKGKVAFVVGNRKVQGVELPTDKISADFFNSLDFTHSKTIVRAICNKRMPSENSPTNIKGLKESTMKYEYIVLLKKNK